MRYARMNDRDWVILKTIAAEKNINSAAESLYMSQPALTYRLKHIEDELNTIIFIRSKKGVTLTPQGEIFIDYADKMLREFETVKLKLAQAGGDVCGRLKIAMSPNFAKYKLEKVLPSFINNYPRVDIMLQTSFSSQVMEQLIKDEVHLGIVRGNHPWPEGRLLISTEPICLVSNKKVSMFELPRLPYILYETDVQLKKEILGWWREHYSVPANVAMCINDTDICRKLISLGLGFSILPGVNKTDNDYRDLHIVPLKHKRGTPLTRSTWLLWRTASERIPAVEKFIENVRGMGEV